MIFLHFNLARTALCIYLSLIVGARADVPPPEPHTHTSMYVTCYGKIGQCVTLLLYLSLYVRVIQIFSLSAKVRAPPLRCTTLQPVTPVADGRACLVHGEDEELRDVDVRRAGGSPHDLLGDVLSNHCGDGLVSFILGVN